MAKWGKQTVIKFYGGEVRLRLSGPKSPDDYIKDLDGIVERSKNLKPAHEAAGRYLMGVVDRNFQSEGRPNRWAPLTPSTIEDRRRKGFGPGPILVRTGRLKSSLTSQGHPELLFETGPRSLRYGSKVYYFNFHQYGTRQMPARPMLMAQKQDRSQLSRIYNTYIRTGKATYKGPR